MIKYFLSFCMLFFSAVLFAESNTNLVIPPYYNASCGQLNGTWKGYITDPSDLYGNGGPWDIEISFFQQGNLVYGQPAAKNWSNSPISELMSKPISATCTNGQLDQIFWGANGQCGDYSKGGEIVSKNMVILYLHAENAMNGTDFLVVLHKVNSDYPYEEPANLSAMMPTNVKTCH